MDENVSRHQAKISGSGGAGPIQRPLSKQEAPIGLGRENHSGSATKIAIDKVYKIYRLIAETEVDMSYIQNAQTEGAGQRSAHAQTFRPAYAGAFAYLVFVLAFVFTGAVVLGLIP
jgi:hypothetical protein